MPTVLSTAAAPCGCDDPVRVAEEEAEAEVAAEPLALALDVVLVLARLLLRLASALVLPVAVPGTTLPLLGTLPVVFGPRTPLVVVGEAAEVGEPPTPPVCTVDPVATGGSVALGLPTTLCRLVVRSCVSTVWMRSVGESGLALRGRKARRRSANGLGRWQGLVRVRQPDTRRGVGAESW